ncbi:MAG: choloylglycine hydrolase [Clostridia bacterium]|nr:choloylglycine hydrolase [Clostridia bacterium]
MCTAITYKTKNCYFGRNLDLERGYGERVVVTPRNFPFAFRYAAPLARHHAMIGMAAVADSYPLYFEATNEKGLSAAGLNFPHNAFYGAYEAGKENIAPFELIPYLLGSFATVDEVKAAAANLNVVHCDFSEGMPVSPLHFMVADRRQSITLEPVKDGLRVYDNPFGVLTNNPPFDFHLQNVGNYMALHEGAAQNRLSSAVPLENYSLGMGALGLPGDFSSASRFVRAFFVKEKSIADGNERESVNQFFHILRAVAMPKGCVKTPSGEYEYTRYSSCCNVDTGVYYYTTYEDATPRRVALGDFDLDGTAIYPFCAVDSATNKSTG